MIQNDGKTRVGQSKKRILIIDDDEATLSVLSDLLTCLGYEVKATTKGLDGVDLLQEEAFDLVVVDMIMPRVGGLALSKVIRQEKPQVPILAISGHYEKLIDSVHWPDVDAILPKPITLNALKIALNDMLTQKRD